MESSKKILLISGLIFCIVYASYQLLFFFEIGPVNLFGTIFGEVGGLIVILIDLILIGTIILSKPYILNYFKTRAIWTFCVAFIVIAIFLDIFFEISFQYSTPSFQILWVDLFFRSIFFIPWIMTWFIILYFFQFSQKTLFLLAALQGVIGEFLLAELFFPGWGMAAALGYNPMAIAIGGALTCLLYGCNLTVPYFPFKELFESKLNQRTTRIKYVISFIPLYAFCLAFYSLQIAIQSHFPYLI